MINKTPLLLVCILGALLWGLPQSFSVRASEAPLSVVATTGMIGDLARAVGGEHVRVQTLLGEGTDPHLHTPTRADVVALNSAELIFYNGLQLEARMGNVLARMERRGRPVVAVAERVHELGRYTLLLEDEDEYDPHLWMDVQAWKLVLEVITDSLIALRPGQAEDFRANAVAFAARMDSLDAYAREVLGSIPEGQRVLVTAHDAFGYLGRAYGLEVRGIQGISTDSEAGVRDIENLVNFLVERQIPAIFIETSVSDRNVRAVIEGARAKGHRVVIGGELFSDAMGAAGTREGTYLGMIEHNVSTIARALGGQVPEEGWVEQ